jgi:hypothetical protein
LQFNQSIEPLRHCINLEQITFGGSFDQSVDSLKHCTNLEQITFRESFTRSVEELCISLPYLKIVINQ